MARTPAFLLLIAVLAAAPGAPVLAQPVAPTPILTLDQDRLYTNSLYGKAQEAKSLADSQTLAAENRTIEADLAAEEASLTEQRKTVTPDAFQVLADAFDAKVELIRSEQEVKATGLKTARDAGRQQFFDAAVPVLADLMNQMGAYAILDHDAVVLSFDSIDVTERAVAAIDAKLGDGSAPPPAP